MNKDIIYIDTDDDITSIIGKIKASKEKIVALVPPKRTGLLQSAVNLRLLARTAKISEKNLVIVSNNKALIALTALAKIPVAKNLQSKPEIAEIAALEIDDGEDIIEGSQLPIGELVKTTDYTKNASEEVIAEDMGSINIDNDATQYVPPTPIGATVIKPEKPAKKVLKVPNFPEFRKKLFLGIAGGILFIIFMVWAIWFAPAATVIVTAKTEPAPVSMTLTLGGTQATDVNKNIVSTVTKQIKKDVSIDFTATGKDQLGTKSKGQVIFKNCETQSTQHLPAGTAISSNGFTFATDSAVDVPAGSGGFLGCSTPGVSSAVGVTASDVGSSYNMNNGTTFSVGNHINTTSVYFRAIASTDLTGGESHEAIVVTQEDILKAGQALVDLPTDSYKQQLIKQFTNGETVISDSFNIDRADAVSAPLVGVEAIGGKAKLTSSTTFSLTAIAKSELESFLREAINKQINGTSQRVYSDGIDKVTVSGFVKSDTSSTVNIAASGQIGPNISETQVKNLVKGKNFGDAQLLLTAIQGVKNVDVNFSYFWVTTIPDDATKIQVKFVVEHA